MEVPSHLWEHFAASPKSLALLARHKGSREAMPPKLVDVLCSSWSSFSSVTPALELQQQVGICFLLYSTRACCIITYHCGDVLCSSWSSFSSVTPALELQLIFVFL